MVSSAYLRFVVNLHSPITNLLSQKGLNSNGEKKYPCFTPLLLRNFYRLLQFIHVVSNF